MEREDRESSPTVLKLRPGSRAAIGEGGRSDGVQSGTRLKLATLALAAYYAGLRRTEEYSSTLCRAVFTARGGRKTVISSAR